jgi:serine/threonine protein phosphatase 1
LIFLGDYIDRGPDPKSVIDYIMLLQEKEYNIRLIRGNHEDYLLRIFHNQRIPRKFLGIPFGDHLKKEWFKYGGKKTLASFRVQEAQEIPSKYISWLEKLEYFIEIDQYILVHAGFNFDIEDPFRDKHAMMWIQEFKTDPEKIGNRKIVHGHVPVSLDFIDLTRKSSSFQFIDLDNGVYMPEKSGFGSLVSLELNSLEMVVQPNVG